MSRPAHAVTVPMQVPFHHCDPLFVVWHGRYFEYFELARGALMQRCDLDIPQMRDLGYRMFVTDAHCRYSFPLRYGEAFEVTAWLTEATPLLKVCYDVRNLSQARRTARAWTRLATVDGQGQLLPETPPTVLERLPEVGR